MTQSTTHRPRKRFGQNFLVDQNIIDRIVATISPAKSDRLVEIGPGRGALTGPLLAACPDLMVIEVDRDLCELLQTRFGAETGFRLYQADALKFDFYRFGSRTASLRVVGNLPYNISTPLLFHLLAHGQVIKDMHFMLQKEVVDRLAAQPGTKAYGRLGIMAQYHCEVTPLLNVPPSAFRPQPAVQSAIVRLLPHTHPPALATDPVFFAGMVKACFQQRRKTLRNTLKNLVSHVQLEQAGVDLQQRPEDLSVTELVTLSNQLCRADV